MKQRNLKQSDEIFVQIVPQTWLGRALAAIGGALLVILGLFFFTLFLAAGAVILAVVLARVFWQAQRIKKHMSDQVIEGEYSVQDDTDQANKQSSDALLRGSQEANKKPR